MKYQDNIKAVLRFMEDKLFTLKMEGNIYGYQVEVMSKRTAVSVWLDENTWKNFTLYDWDADTEDGEGWKNVNQWERNINNYVLNGLCDMLQKKLDDAEARAAAFEVENNNLKAAAAL